MRANLTLQLADKVVSLISFTLTFTKSQAFFYKAKIEIYVLRHMISLELKPVSKLGQQHANKLQR